MTTTIKYTNKSAIYTFDGYSDGYGAYIQGALTGRFIVPMQHAGLINNDYALDDLIAMRQSGGYGIVLKNRGRSNDC